METLAKYLKTNDSGRRGSFMNRDTTKRNSVVNVVADGEDINTKVVKKRKKAKKIKTNVTEQLSGGGDQVFHSNAEGMACSDSEEERGKFALTEVNIHNFHYHIGFKPL